MNIAEKMTELIPILHEGHGGLNGVRLPDVLPLSRGQATIQGG